MTTNDTPPAWATFTNDDMHAAGLETAAAEMERDAALRELNKVRAELDKVRAQLADTHNRAHADATNLQQILRDKTALANERDAMREVVEAAKAWRAQFGEWGPLDSADTPSGDLCDAVDALPNEAGVAR